MHLAYYNNPTQNVSNRYSPVYFNPFSEHDFSFLVIISVLPVGQVERCYLLSLVWLSGALLEQENGSESLA